MNFRTSIFLPILYSFSVVEIVEETRGWGLSWFISVGHKDLLSRSRKRREGAKRYPFLCLCMETANRKVMSRHFSTVTDCPQGGFHLGQFSLPLFRQEYHPKVCQSNTTRSNCTGVFHSAFINSRRQSPKIGFVFRRIKAWPVWT